KVKSPSEKKRLAYDRDHATLAEYPHAFRKKWPQKKASATRAVRRTVRQILNATGEDTLVAVVRRRPVRKGASSLREIVRIKQQKRREMVGAHKARKAKRSRC